MFHFTFPPCIFISILLVDFSHERIHKRNTLESNDCAFEIIDEGIELINFGIKAIETKVENGSLDIGNNFYDNLFDVFNWSKEQEKAVNELVTEQLYKFNDTIRETYFKKENVFWYEIIHFYTTKYAYKEINTCLRKHECSKKRLTKKEQYLAPYSAVLMAVLLYWPNLTKEEGMTYRGINLDKEDIDQFYKGLRFSWPSFVSSSRVLSGATLKNFTCLFVFDNSEVSLWSPRRISEYAYNPDQDEALYPPGGEFQVEKKDENVDGKTVIILKLISTDKLLEEFDYLK